MNFSLVALVPMRHESERVPGKNFRLFAGRPLYHHIIKAVSKCKLINEVVIDTDSPVIMEDARQCFPHVRVVERPKHLRSGTTPMNDVLLYTIEKFKADFYMQTHSTNPLIRTETISNAIQRFFDEYPVYDSLFSVTKRQIRLWDSLTMAINHNPAILLRTQDLPPIFEENSCLYLFRRETLITRHNRIGERPLMFEIDRLEAFDIDEELDFKIAEFLFLDREKKQRE